MKNSLKLLYNPFEKIAGWKAFILGGIIVCVSVIIAYYGNQYYQGAMNVRLVSDANLGYAFLSQGVSLLCMVILFFIAGQIFSRGVRFQDVLGTVTLARYPYIIPAFFGYIMNFESINNITLSALSGNIAGNMDTIILLTVIGFVMLIILVWYIVLLWNAFRVSTGIKGWQGIIIFIAVLILTDILVYLILYLINRFIIQ